MRDITPEQLRSAVALHSSTQASFSSARANYQRGRKGLAALDQAIVLHRTIEARARDQIQRAAAKVELVRALPEVAQALASKAAVVQAEQDHAAAAAALAGLMAARPVAVREGRVVATTAERIVAELEAGAELIVPSAWASDIPPNAGLVLVAGVVTTDPAYLVAMRRGKLEAELSEQRRILAAAERAKAIEAELAALKG